MMRHALLLIFFTVFLVGANGSMSFGENREAQPAQESGETRVYEVFGMDCPGCHGGLEKLVMKLPAVQRAEANWKEQQLTVIAKPEHQLRDEDIHEAIKRANFTVGTRIQ
jgi:copper chaperone CopZ